MKDFMCLLHSIAAYHDSMQQIAFEREQLNQREAEAYYLLDDSIKMYRWLSETEIDKKNENTDN